MNQRSFQSRAARGAATVEMALSMLVFIPVFMFALFLDDLLRYSLDAQEAALSTVWDFTVQDYNQGLQEADTTVSGPLGGRSMVQKQARLMFCDHESGKDRYNEMVPVTNEDGTTGENYADCVDTNHHTALVAHVCWINDDAKQVTCEAPERGVGSLGVPVHDQYMSAFTHGGLIRCSARAVVENYLLPETFLPEFSRYKDGSLSKKQWARKVDGNDVVHGNAKAGTAETAYFLPEERLAILTDTWALNERPTSDRPVAARPGQKGGELYSRVANVYTNRLNVGHPMVMAGSAAFIGQAVANNLLNPDFGEMVFGEGLEDKGGGDNPRSPNIASAPHLENMQEPSSTVTESGSDASYFNTEWRDWERDNNQRTYEERGKWYLGCRNSGSC